MFGQMRCCEVLPLDLDLEDVKAVDLPEVPVPPGVAPIAPERAKECADGGSQRYLSKYATARTLPDLFEVDDVGVHSILPDFTLTRPFESE